MDGSKKLRQQQEHFRRAHFIRNTGEVCLSAFDKKWWRIPFLLYCLASVFLTLLKASVICETFAFFVSVSYGFIRLFIGKSKWWAFLLFIDSNAFKNRETPSLCYIDYNR